jgi:hypothetical protein
MSSAIRSNTGNFRRGSSCCCDSGGTGPTGPTGPQGSGNIIVITDLYVSASDLASGGTVTLQAASSPTARYVILNLYFCADGAIPWENGAANRSILLTDGTNDYGTFSQSTILSASNASFGYFWNTGLNTFGILTPHNTAPNEPSVAGADLYFTYTGGTTDYAFGRGAVSAVLYQYAD